MQTDLCAYWLTAAREDLAGTPFTRGLSRATRLRLAIEFIGYALAEANKAGSARYRCACLRILNWLRADLRREVA